MISAVALHSAIGAGEGNRTLVFSLEGCCSTIELHPLRRKLSAFQLVGIHRTPGFGAKAPRFPHPSAPELDRKSAESVSLDDLALRCRGGKGGSGRT